MEIVGGSALIDDRGVRQTTRAAGRRTASRIQPDAGRSVRLQEVDEELCCFERALRREKMTIRQFIGLYLALGAALSRDHVPVDRDVEQILERGRLAIAELKKDQRIFSSLPDDEAYFLREKSGWLAVVDRAARLKLVHPDNLTLVARHRDRLAVVMPEEFKSNPFLEFLTILDDRGVPFQEPLGRENDDHLSWSRDRALVGSVRSGEAEVP